MIDWFNALAGVTDPEAKRKAIGQTFIDVFEQEAHKIRNIKWLGQGTIYSDVIESADSRFKKAHTIKSHHVGFRAGTTLRVDVIHSDDDRCTTCSLRVGGHLKPCVFGELPFRYAVHRNDVRILPK